MYKCKIIVLDNGRKSGAFAGKVHIRCSSKRSYEAVECPDKVWFLVSDRNNPTKLLTLFLVSIASVEV